MYKSIYILLGLLVATSASVVVAQEPTGIEIPKKSKLNKQQKELLGDSLMADRFTPTEPVFRIDEPLENQILPLDSLVAIAIKNYPNLAVQQKVVARENANFQHEKVLWTRNIFGSGFYFNGSQNALITSAVDANASTSLTNGARYGLTVQVPLYEVVGRKRKNKIAQLNYETESLKIKQLEREIEQQVTLAYGNLVSTQKLFLIASEGKQSSAINVENAELEFEQGIIPLSELSRIMEIDIRLRTNYENARAQFFNAFHQFEILVGKKLEELVKSK